MGRREWRVREVTMPVDSEREMEGLRVERGDIGHGQRGVEE